MAHIVCTKRRFTTVRPHGVRKKKHTRHDVICTYGRRHHTRWKCSAGVYLYYCIFRNYYLFKRIFFFIVPGKTSVVTASRLSAGRTTPSGVIIFMIFIDYLHGVRVRWPTIRVLHGVWFSSDALHDKEKTGEKKYPENMTWNFPILLGLGHGVEI